MEHSIGVGAIIGLVIATSIYVKESVNFTKLQKTILLICIVFPPLQWLGIIIISIYNNILSENSGEKVAEKQSLKVKEKLNSTIENLKDLKQKDILSEEEYIEKIKKVENTIAKEDIINSKEYKQLQSLFNSDILSKDEFEEKKKLLFNKSVNINNISPPLKYVVSGKKMTIEEIEYEFRRGNYILNKDTLIEVNGQQKTIYEIPSFKNIITYFPPRSNE